MDEATRTELALFRFSLIAPLVNGLTEQSPGDYLEEVCGRAYDVPGLGRKEFAPRTLRSWLAEYRKHGLEGLKPQRRRDRGKFRALAPEAATFLTRALQASPHHSATALYEDLVQAGLLGFPPCSLSTVQRFLKTVAPPQLPELERRRFEVRHANDCWQSDVADGPYLKVNGQKKKAYLIGFLDDASRLVPHAEFGFANNYTALERVFKKAVQKRGRPKKLFVDNGKIYQTKQLRLVCARLGIALSFTRPYSPASKGKVERFWRTLREQFLERLDPYDLSLAELNEKLGTYLEGTYHQRPHGSLDGLSPMQRWLKDREQIRLVDSPTLERAFWYEVERRVSKDATIAVAQRLFEVLQTVIGARVRIHYHPDDLSRVWLQAQPDGPLVPVTPLHKVDNAFIPRRQNERPPIAFVELFAPTKEGR